MSELNRIKTVLFTAHSLNDALNKLDDLGVRYYESDTLQMFVCIDFNIQFWPSESSRMALTVFCENQFMCFDDRRTFLAHQPEMAETSVPAASPDLAGERPLTDSGCCLFCGFDLTGFHDVCDCELHSTENEQSTDSVDNRTITWPNPVEGMTFKAYPKTGGAS